MANRWTEEEDRYLLTNHKKHDVKLLAKVLNRSPEAVKTRLYKVQRTPKENLYQAIEFGWFLERANRPLPSSHELPKTVIDTKLAPKWTGNRRGGNAFRHTKTGFRSDIGITVRSGWEANIARTLKSYAIAFEYEPAIFTYPIKRGQKMYTPDFWLPGSDEWIEVKGYFDRNSYTKMKRFRKYYPDHWDRLTMIISKASQASRDYCVELDVPNVLFYQDIAKAMRGRVKNWEGK